MEQQDSQDDARMSILDSDIAIIGMSGRFPGADDVDTFWRNISTGVESFAVFTDEDLVAGGERPEVFADPNYVRSRPVLNNIRGFDPGFFGNSPRDAALADPQTRLFAECAWEALESAGYAIPDHRGLVGVYAGMNISTYLLTRPNAFRMAVEIDGLMVGNDKDALATAVSYRLDLRGPSVTVQTFCSTSLVATHIAVESIRRGECDMALAGGVSIRIPDRVGYLYKEGDQASPDGHVRTFDAEARGSMFGDGVAVVALKPLTRAVTDRDTVLGVIRGSAINNDGALKFSFHAPSLDGQRRCVAAAIARAGVDPADISYVEAHGTATEVGDPMEVAALISAFGPTDEKQYCVLGSVKPNVGHLDRASGVTGLIKVVQSMRHELIPGTLNYTTPNPEIDFANSPFRVTAEPTPWPRTPDRPRIAGVSSLGAGGTNAHVIVVEPPLYPARPPRPRRWQVLPVSARSADAAQRSCAALGTHLAEHPDLDLGDVAYTLQIGRKLFGHRRIVIADSIGRAATALTDPAAPLGRSDATVGRRAGFLIAGVGEQYPGMVAALYADEPEFRADVDECLAVLGHAAAAQLSDMFVIAEDSAENAGSGANDLARLLGRESPAGRTSTDAAHLVQPAVFVAEYALARQLMRWGVQPEIMVGYSLGEYVAACLSGVLSLTDALRLVAKRAELIASQPAGAMLAVATDERRLRAVLGEQVTSDLDVAIRTGSQVVLAGPVPTVDAAGKALLDAGIGCRRLDTTHAFHSRMLAGIAEELTEWVAEHITPRAPAIPYVSNVTGEPVTEQLVTDPGYWARHMCETVEFGAGLAHALAPGDLTLVEIGPGQSLGALTRAHPNCGKEQWPLVVTTLPAAADPRDPHAALAEAVGRLWLTGVPVDWGALHRVGDSAWSAGRVRLPTYPFERQDYWLEAETLTAGPAQPTIDENDPTSILRGLPKLPETEWINVPVWRQTTVRPAIIEGGNWLVYTDSGLADTLTNSLRGHLEAVGAQVTLVRPGDRYGTDGDSYVLRPGSPEDIAAALADLSTRDRTPDHVVHLWNVDAGDGHRRGLHTLVALARAAGDLGLPAWSLDIVTVGGHRVLPNEPIRPEVSTVLGPARLIPVEYPMVSTRLIDIDPATAAERPRALLAEIRSAPTDQVVALRGRQRWIPGYEVLDPAGTADAARSVDFRRGGSYLVTGGLGGIGLAMAERIAEDCQGRLVLMGRTPVPPADQWDQILATESTAPEVRRRLEGLRRLTNSGVEVVTVAGDVSKIADVRRAVDTALARFGRLDGVLHCAGVPAVGLMQFKTAADIERVLAPKVSGSLAIAEALRDVPVDFVALFSSTTSATGGGPGQVDYCAANAFLDAFAQSDPIPGCPVVSVDWGEWTYNGWTSGLDNYDEGSRAFFESYRETFGISFDDGWATLRRILVCGEPHVIVSTQDFAPIVAMSRRSSIESHQATVKKARDAMGRHPRPDLSTAYVEPQTETEQAIADVWAEALGLEQVGVHDNFFELGGNSLIGMEIIAAIRRELGISHLPPHLLYQASTVATLAKEAMAGQDGGAEPADEKATEDRDRHRSRIEQRRNMLRTGRAS